MPQRYLIWIGWIGIVVLAVWLRLHDLSDRPIHADEATGARIFAQRLEGSGYNFDPKHFHGPLLSVNTTPIANLRNESSWPELTLLTLRLGPALAGLLAVLTPLLWIKPFGARSALAAGALLATSPLLVYYNRMYIHESWLMLFGMLALTAIYRLAINPSLFKAVIAGLCVGLMFATKETFAISILSWATAVGIYMLNRRFGWTAHGPLPKLRTYLAPAGLLALTAFAVGSYFYSDGLRNWQGVADAVRTYFVYETTAGHSKSLGYYFQLLVWPKQALGLWWSEAVILLLGIEACLHSLFRRTNVGTISFLTVATLAHLLIYSLIAYKTPWLMLLPWAHACLLAGSVFSEVDKLKPALRIALTLVLLAGLTYQTKQSLHASGRIANDARNPYAYVPTSKDPQKIEDWLLELKALPDTPALSPIAVTGQEYWPLPWYLREFETVGYWPQPVEDFIEFPVVFAMPAQIEACDQLLANSHTKLPRGLRSNVPIVLYLRNDLWTLWSETPSE